MMSAATGAIGIIWQGLGTTHVKIGFLTLKLKPEGMIRKTNM